MKVSKGYTAPGAVNYTSSRADVEVDEMDLLRALVDADVNDPDKIRSRLNLKEVFLILEGEATRFLTYSRLAMGDLEASEANAILATVKKTKLEIISSVEARNLDD